MWISKSPFILNVKIIYFISKHIKNKWWLLKHIDIIIMPWQTKESVPYPWFITYGLKYNVMITMFILKLHLWVEGIVFPITMEVTNANKRPQETSILVNLQFVFLIGSNQLSQIHVDSKQHQIVVTNLFMDAMVIFFSIWPL